MTMYKVYVGKFPLHGEFDQQEADRKKASLQSCIKDTILLVPVKPEPQLQGGKRDA